MDGGEGDDELHGYNGDDNVESAVPVATSSTAGAGARTS